MPIDSLQQMVVALADRLQKPLPGAAAHEPLRATPTGIIKPNFEHQVPPKPGSVLILLYPQNEQILIPLIKRPDYLGAHSGQVSLPGGKAEPGETAIETALREAHEEIGIEGRHVHVLGVLSPFFVVPSNFMVTPVVGYLRQSITFVPDAKEVDRILHADLLALLREDAVREKEILAARLFPMRAPHFLVEDEVVWGATAMILNELRVLLRELGMA